ncbi:MAG: YesL family protein [Propionibacteriaceae bacterium]|jgi:uncharacterized membrane protein YesL|nr:YesL family protein [Propionibacteriaceae bacterium]
MPRISINPEGPTLQGLATLIAMIGLNIIFLIACLPVITIGPACAALFQVMLGQVDGERGYLIRGFFEAWRDCWRPALAVSLIIGAPGLLLIYSAIFWLQLTSILSAILGLLSALLAVYALLVISWGLALIARYRNSIRATLHNALILPLGQPLASLGLAVIPLVPIGLGQVWPAWFWLAATIGCSLAAYGATAICLTTFRRLEAMPLGTRATSPAPSTHPKTTDSSQL